MAATRLILPNFFPAQATNGWASLFAAISSGGGLTVFSVLAGAISFLVEFGGISIFAGGFLCYTKHLRSGKELVGIGTTFGFADLLLSIPSLASSNYAPPYLAAWAGLFFAVFASRHIKGPSSSYAGEVRRLMSSFRGRFVREEKKKRRRERRSRRRRSQTTAPRPNLPAARQYNVADDKNRQS